MAQKRVLSGLPYEVGGYVYIIQCGKYYKIGRTKRMGARMVNFRVHNPYNIELVYYKNCENDHKIEELLHTRYGNFLHRGEWFIFNESLVREIINIIEDYE